MSEWISVKDRLPEENESFLCCDITGICQDERDPFIAYLEKHKWYLPWVAKPNPQTVTHWQPLPETPS